jgi:hypothetical protein
MSAHTLIFIVFTLIVFTLMELSLKDYYWGLDKSKTYDSLGVLFHYFLPIELQKMPYPL